MDIVEIEGLEAIKFSPIPAIYTDFQDYADRILKNYSRKLEFVSIDNTSYFGVTLNGLIAVKELENVFEAYAWIQGYEHALMELLGDKN